LAHCWRLSRSIYAEKSDIWFRGRDTTPRPVGPGSTYISVKSVEMSCHCSFINLPFGVSRPRHLLGTVPTTATVIVARARLIDIQGAAQQFLAGQAGNCGERFRLIRHLYEAKSA